MAISYRDSQELKDGNPEDYFHAPTIAYETIDAAWRKRVNHLTTQVNPTGVVKSSMIIDQ